jgi:hypothetical protein
MDNGVFLSCHYTGSKRSNDVIEPWNNAPLISSSTLENIPILYYKQRKIHQDVDLL